MKYRLGNFLQRVSALLLTAALLLAALPQAAFADGEEDEWDYGRSSGFIQGIARFETAPDGWKEVRTIYDLVNMEAHPDDQYILMNDITMLINQPFFVDTPFNGQLDGNGYTITYTKKETGEWPPTIYAGLFGQVSGIISNLRVAGTLEIEITGNASGKMRGTTYAGGIAGVLTGSALIQNCVSDVNITTNITMMNKPKYSAVGGIAGTISGSTSAVVTYCRNRASVNHYSNTGGIIGSTTELSSSLVNIFGCRNDGTVTGSLYCGGIVGVFDGSGQCDIACCVNTAGVTDNEIAGGILGGYTGSKISSHTVADCLNTGDIRATSAPSYGGGIAGSAVRVHFARCVNTGNVQGPPDGAIAGWATSTSAFDSCYWLDTARSRFGASSGGRMETDRTGALSSEQMTKEASYAGLDFTDTWVMDRGTGLPWPLPVYSWNYENVYEKTIEMVNFREFLTYSQYYSMVTSVAGANGGVASALHKSYEEANLDTVNNGWRAIEQFNKFADLDVTVDNDYQILLGDLLNQMFGSTMYARLLTESVRGTLSNLMTGLMAVMDAEEIKTIREILDGMAADNDFSDVVEIQAMAKAMDFISQNAVGKIAGKAFKVAGPIYDFSSVIVHGYEDIKTTINKYVLYNAFSDATVHYASFLEDTAACFTESGANTIGAKAALNDLADEMRSMVDKNPGALFNALGGDILNLIQAGGMTAAKTILNLVMDTNPFLAAIKVGLASGVLIGDQVTGMNSIAYNGAMMNAAGYLAEAMYTALDQRISAYSADMSYQNAMKMKTGLDLYFSLEILACDYAIRYDDAKASGWLRSWPGGNIVLPNEEREKAAMRDYRVRLQRAWDDTLDMFDPNNTLVTYTVNCPAEVTVRAADGTVIAHQATGSATIAEGYEGYYALLGENLDVKTGWYDPSCQTLTITGETDGNMDISLAYSQGGAVFGMDAYNDMLLAKGSSYTIGDGFAETDDGEVILPEVHIRKSRFTDVDPTKYYAAAVDWAVDNQITSGTSDTTFSPNAGCTRAQVVTFLWRAAGEPKPGATANPFKDVAADKYYYNAVLWAVENNITAGTSATTFDPNRICKRCEIVTFLYRSGKARAIADLPSPFTDVKSGYYYKPVLWAVQNGITSGTSATTFSPNDTCTRGQVVTFLYRDKVPSARPST